jgi:1-acyl-sn-glycerol-3-phosphate acyltransferase
MTEINLTPKLTWQHHFLHFGILTAVQVFYADIELFGQENIPLQEQPAIYVLNHPNFVLDRLMLSIGLRRRIPCMGKSTFFSNPISRLVMETFGALPIYRKVDEGLPYGPHGDATERNKRVIAYCRSLLHDGKEFALFPEGTTHSEPQLLPLQSGAARIALEAEAESNWQQEVQIIPIGLWYEDKTKFRSIVRVAFGRPLLVKTYASQYQTDPDKTIQELTKQMTDGLLQAIDTAKNTERIKPLASAWQRVAMMFLLLITFPLATIGFLMNIIPYWITGPLVPHPFNKHDTRTATGKMLLNVFLLPIIWLSTAIIVGIKTRGWWGGLLLITASLLSYLSVRWLESLKRNL